MQSINKEEAETQRTKTMNNFKQEHKKRQQVFNNAKNAAHDQVFAAVAMTENDTCRWWKRAKQNLNGAGLVKISWSHDLRDAQNDTILLPKDIPLPQCRDKKTNLMRPIMFRCSRVFQDDEFLKRINEHYAQFNLQIKINRDRRRQERGRWWINISELEGKKCTLE